MWRNSACAILFAIFVAQCTLHIGDCYYTNAICDEETEEYSKCVTGCDETCIWRVHGLCPQRLKKCREGCACKRGYVSFSAWNRDCIPRDECEKIRATLDKTHFY